MNASTELNQRLLELVYGLVPDDEAAELQRRIAAERDVAEAWERSRELAGLLAEAARVDRRTPAPLRAAVPAGDAATATGGHAASVPPRANAAQRRTSSQPKLEASPTPVPRLLAVPVRARARGSRATAAAVVLACACLLVVAALFVGSSPEVPPAGGDALAQTAPYPPRAAEWGLLVAQPRPQPPEQPVAAVGQTLATGDRERRRVALPDGSIAYLNENTSLSVEAGRRVRVDRGEVFVEVAPRRGAEAGSQPFVVAARDRGLTAIGTKFAVNVDEPGGDAPPVPPLAVVQGRVKAEGYDAPIAAGQQLVPLQIEAARAAGAGPVGPAGPLAVVPAVRSSELLAWTRELRAAAAPRLVPDSPHAGGALVAVDPAGQQMKLSLRKYHVDVHIADGFARTTIDQTYFNHEQRQLEGTFYFPLPADASLSRLAMYVEGLRMEGGMVERDHARNVFEEILYTRRDPALLEWVDGSTFKMRVFPLEARHEKRILLSYTQRLPCAYGRTTYRFPAGHNLEVARASSTYIRVKGAAGLDWHSPSHELAARTEGDDLVLEAKTGPTAIERDIVLELTPRAVGQAFQPDTPNVSDSRNGAATPAPRQAGKPDLRASRLSSFVHDEHRYLMLRMQPDLPGELERPRRHWTILFEAAADRDPLLARVQIDAVETLLDHAEHDDTFALVVAGTTARAFSDEPLPCAPDNVSEAVAFLEQAHLIGALDLEAALDACAPLLAAGENPHLVHVGSGVPILGSRRTDELARRVAALSDVQSSTSASHHGPRTADHGPPQLDPPLPAPRVTYVGVPVGHRWSREFMEGAARRTGGLVWPINPDEDVHWKAFELVSTLNAPRLVDVRVTDDAGKLPFLAFAHQLAQGEELCAVTQLAAAEPLPKSLTVTGTLGGKRWQRTVALADAPPADGAGYLPRFWAKLEIDRLLAEDAAANKDRIIELSKAMYVMSPYTSLLVLETEAMYEQYKVDRGRRDHWAMYPAPERIEVVHEPVAPLLATSAAGRAEEAPVVAPTPAEDARRRWDRAVENALGSIVLRRPAATVVAAAFDDQTTLLNASPVFLDDDDAPVLLHDRPLWLHAVDPDLVASLERESRSGDRRLSRNLDRLSRSTGDRSLAGRRLNERLRETELLRQIVDFDRDDLAVSSRGSASRREAELHESIRRLGRLQSFERGPLSREVSGRSAPPLIERYGRVLELYQQPLSKRVGAPADVGLRIAAPAPGDRRWSERSEMIVEEFGEDSRERRVDPRFRTLFPGNELSQTWRHRGVLLGDGSVRVFAAPDDVSRGGWPANAGYPLAWRQWDMQWSDFDIDLLNSVNSSRLNFQHSADEFIAGPLFYSANVNGVISEAAADPRLTRAAIISREGRFGRPSSVSGPQWSGFERPIASMGRPALQASRPQPDGRTQQFRAPSAHFFAMSDLLRHPEVLNGLVPGEINGRLGMGGMSGMGMGGMGMGGMGMGGMGMGGMGWIEPSLNGSLNGVFDEVQAEWGARAVLPIQPWAKNVRLFTDLVAHAPGLNTTRADVASVLDEELAAFHVKRSSAAASWEADLASAARPGNVDPAARRLIDRARSAGWEAVTWTGREGQPDLTIVCDGRGRHVYERLVSEGLREHVVCDGETLLHLYPEIGLGAQRIVSRFHRAGLRSLVPWFVPPAEDLARGADVRRVDERTVAIVPHVLGADSNAGSGGGTGRETRATGLAVHLVFAADGRLAERRLIQADDQTVLARWVFGADGPVRVLDADGAVLAEVPLHREAADVPVLQPDTSELVVLPLPYRSEKWVEQHVGSLHPCEDETDAAGPTEAARLAHVAAAFAADAPGRLRAIIDREFFQRGDHRPGLYTLLAGTSARWVADGETGEALRMLSLRIDGAHRDTPLARSLEESLRFALNGRASAPDASRPRPAAGDFLSRLAEARDVYALWTSADDSDRLRREAPAERTRALEVIERSRSHTLAWLVANAVAASATDGAFLGQLADVARWFDDVPEFVLASRSLRAAWLERAGRLAESRTLLRDLYLEALAAGVLLPPDPRFAEAIAETAESRRAWRGLVRELHALSLAAGLKSAALRLALECRWMNDAPLARTLFDRTLTAFARTVPDAGSVRDSHLRHDPAFAVQAAEHLMAAGEPARADALLVRLLADERFRDEPALWRRAAAAAHARGDVAEAIVRLDRAVELEFARLPEVVNLATFRQQYGELFTFYQNAAAARVPQASPPEPRADVPAGQAGKPDVLPADFTARVLRAADRWRRIDPDATAACRAAAQVLEQLGHKDLAWAYLTTPLAARPNEAAPWLALAKHLQQERETDGRLDRALEAYATAFEIEPTNAQIAWDHAQLLESAGRAAEARPLYRRLVEGSWQPRFRSLQAQARQKLAATPATDTPPRE